MEWKLLLPKPLSAIQRYGLAVLSIALAIGGSLVGRHYDFRDVAFPLYLSAIAVATWYGGNGPAALALVLACLSFDYFFTVPYYELNISRSDLAYYAAFAFSALLVTWFSSRRRRIEGELRLARDQLQIEVAERTQQASLLNLTHDTIFVRDMNDSHHLLESWGAGAVRMDARGSDREAFSGSAPDGLSRADG